MNPIPQQVHIHTLTIPDTLATWLPSADEIARYLSPTEQQRYNRYLVKTKKTEFFIARKFTKELLATKLGMTPSQMELRPDTYGKPFLFMDGKPLPLFFNISHTKGLIACVISNCKHTGIDVEHFSGSQEKLVQRFFHPREIADYMELDLNLRDQQFYTLWTLKEAYLKAIGHGLSVPLDSFRFSLQIKDSQQVAFIHFDHQHSTTADMQFFMDNPTSQHYLAIAAKGKNPLQLTTYPYTFTKSASFSPLIQVKTKKHHPTSAQGLNPLIK